MANPIHHPRYVLFRGMLKEARLAAGMTQVDLANAIGKEQTDVSKIERGERRVDYPEFLEIADALGIEVGDFTKRYRAALKKQSR